MAWNVLGRVALSLASVGWECHPDPHSISVGADARQWSTGTEESPMKVAYVFSTSGQTARYKLGKMILPQLEEGRHGVEVVGMFFFDDNTYILRQGDPIGERVGK